MARCGLLLGGDSGDSGRGRAERDGRAVRLRGFGLAGAPGAGICPRTPTSSCATGWRASARQRAHRGLADHDCRAPRYKSRAFTSVVNESVCVTMAVSAPTCTGPGTNEVMSETYSPASTREKSPPTGSATWATHRPRRPPTRSSSLRVQRFETVVDEVLDTAPTAAGWTSPGARTARGPRRGRSPRASRLSAKPSRAVSTSGRETRPSAVSGSGATPPAGTASISLAPPAELCADRRRRRPHDRHRRERDRERPNETVVGRTTITRSSSRP